MSRPSVHRPQAVILAAGMGSRLGRPLPKPLTILQDGRTMLQQQIDNLHRAFGPDVPITAVVGFEASIIMAAAPDLLFAYNPDYASTNTSKSLLRGLLRSRPGGVLWLNGDVVFDPRILVHARPWMEADRTFVCVDRASVADEEVKYTLDVHGHVRELSKTVVGGLGEAVGINFVSSADKPLLVERLRACEDGDYFERGIETAIASAGMRVHALDITGFGAVEVDFEHDLLRANRIHATGASALEAAPGPPG